MKNSRLFFTLFITIIILFFGLKIIKLNSKQGVNLPQESSSRRTDPNIAVFS